MIASIVLNDMDRTHYAFYGYRSWMLQDIQEPYEVILNLFNDKKDHFQTLESGCNTYCSRVINAFPPPLFFNISAANNIGLHFAKGKYVLFVNSDIIYPSNYLRIILEELTRRDIHYALGARVNLNKNQTSKLKNPIEYDNNDNFDFMIGYENLPSRTLGCGSSPWTILRSVAESVGGFDPKILCHEDSEFNDRVMHYLIKTGHQKCLYSITNLYGYHLYHSTSELYDVSLQAKSILEPRRLRLLASSASAEDTQPTKLESIDDLLKDLYQTKMPELKRKKITLLSKGFRRIKGASKILLLGED